jgi:hypothetical protein
MLDSGASTHMMPDAVRFQDIGPIRSEVRVEDGTEVPVYVIGTVSLFVVWKDWSL